MAMPTTKSCHRVVAVVLMSRLPAFFPELTVNPQNARVAHKIVVASVVFQPGTSHNCLWHMPL